MYISLIIMLICILISVAFITLMERKVLGLIQLRLGPNQVGYKGILQPMSDAVKLFSKENTFPLMSNLFLYYLSPIFSIFLSLLLWLCMPFIMKMLNFNYSVLFFLCCSSLGVYSLLISGWSSNSNYSMLGAMRGIAQMISYEVSMSLILLSFLLLIMSLNLFEFMKIQKYIWLLMFMFPLSLMWLVSILAETNRTPFDFAEGESELVSGFNIEYSGGGFALIFMAEYSSIIFLSMMSVLLFLGANIYSWFFFIKVVVLSFFFIWVRGTLPRFRYDKLMYLSWKSFLPISLNFYLFYYSFMIYML
uniref:NADH-ubiquinone oxidoreductase chain 1 n=1 Tax=Scydmaeninae sp. BMNH 1274313 TaxID=1796549 RepID=A0A126TE13_9COLE|nr:NADH dehydrogenase subunit 1 [Scydmaeninae sp. BMNH 1274313]